jgi:hypothetical protein
MMHVVDNCKFLHDRGDYKSGWQLEREWDADQEKKRKKMLGEEGTNTHLHIPHIVTFHVSNCDFIALIPFLYVLLLHVWVCCSGG